jgi:putative PIN family toxin of toxin-antitoxin system
MRVVFDTNVLISALLWGKRLEPIFESINTRRAIPCFSAETIIELRRVLQYEKIRRQAERIKLDLNLVLKDLLANAHIAKPGEYSDLPPIPEDPTDRMFLACAIAAHAEYVVSGDKHLLSVGVYRHVPIVTSMKFIERLETK